MPVSHLASQCVNLFCADGSDKHKKVIFMFYNRHNIFDPVHIGIDVTVLVMAIRKCYMC